MHEVLEVVVDRAGEVHHVAGVAVGDDRQHEHLVGDLPAGPVGDAARADEIDVERQVRPVLLDGAAGHDADLAQLDGVVDLGPGQFLVAVLGGGAAHVFGSNRFVRAAHEVQRSKRRSSLPLTPLRFRCAALTSLRSS